MVILLTFTFFIFSIWNFFQKKFLKGSFYLAYTLSSFSCWIYSLNYLDSYNNLFTSYLYIVLFLVSTTESLLVENKILRNTTQISNQLVKFLNILIIISLIALVLNLIYFSKSYSLLQNSLIEIEDYKNFGGADEYLNSLLPGGRITLSITRLLSISSFILIPYTIYNLSINKVFKAIFSFAGSLNIALLGMVGLSRSGITSQIFVYVILFAMSFKKFPIKVRYASLSLLILIGILSYSYFSTITISRFEGYDTWWAFSNYKNIDNPILFSLLYYFGSWIELSFDILSNIELPFIGHGHSSFSLIHYLDNTTNLFIDKGDYLEKLLGADAVVFIGLPVVILIDLGIIGISFYFLYLYLINKLGNYCKNDYFNYDFFYTFFFSFYHHFIMV